MRHVWCGTLATLAVAVLAAAAFAESSAAIPPCTCGKERSDAAGTLSETSKGDCPHCSAKSTHTRSEQAETSRSRLVSSKRSSSNGNSALQELGREVSGGDAAIWVSDRTGSSETDHDASRGVLNAVWISDLVESDRGQGLLTALGEESIAHTTYASAVYESSSESSMLGKVLDGMFWTDSRDLRSADCDGCPPAGYVFGNLWSNFNQEYTVWARSEYLYWQGKGDRLPALVTVSPAGTAQTQGVIPVAGALGQATTTVVFGDARFNNTERPGGRLTIGYGHFSGIQVDYYRLENSSAEFSITSDGDPILARPFEDVTLAANNALIVAMPNFFDAALMQTFDIEGNITVKAASVVQSAGVLYRHLIWMESNPEYDGFWRLNLVGGYRFFDLDDSLTITDTVFPLGGFFALGTSISHIDQFTTENEFHGGEIGLLFSGHRRRLSLDLTAKVALGNMHQVLDINGVRNVFDPVAMSITSSPEGLLAQSTNIGRYTRDEFSVIPEVGVNVGVQLTCRVKAVAGYTFIYASQTQRPGDAIDLLLNRSSPLVGAARPAVHGNDSFFWLHGGTAGIEVRY